MKFVAVVMVTISAICLAQTPKQGKSAPAKAYSCVAGQNEQCASDLWYADYQRLKAMRAKYAPPQDIADMMNGIEMRLTQQIPQGFTWDPVKERFVKQAPPSSIPAPEVKK